MLVHYWHVGSGGNASWGNLILWVCDCSYPSWNPDQTLWSGSPQLTKKRNLLRFLVSSKSVFQTWHRIVRALKTQEANPCPNTREIWMVPENRHLSGLTCGTGLDWWLVEIEIKWESRHVKEGWGKNKIPLSLIQGKTEASQELNCKINRKWIREKYEKSH